MHTVRGLDDSAMRSSLSAVLVLCFAGVAVGSACPHPDSAPLDAGSAPIDSGLKDGGENADDAGHPQALDCHSDGGSVITIKGFGYYPEDIDVDAGATLCLHNIDNTFHTVTSEAKLGNFQIGSVNNVSFNSGAFQGDKTLTLSESAPSGTVVPYFCLPHGASMGEGRIHIR